MALRLSGINSGMDTDSVVQALVMDTKKKKESYEKKKTKLEWTQDKWKGINTKVGSLFAKVGNMRWSTSYNLKKTTVSDATKATVTASNTAVTGTQKLNILQVAQSGYLTGGKLATTASTSTTLAELGYTGAEGTINVDKGDGTSAAIKVTATTTIDELTEQLKAQGLNASLDTTNNRIFVSSKKTGIDNDFNLIAGDPDGMKALQAFGLATDITTGEGDDATDTATGATYRKYGKYAIGADGQPLGSATIVEANITKALADYTAAKTKYTSATTQIDNIHAAAQGYGAAYASVQDFYNTYGKALGTSGADVKAQFEKLSQMSSSTRDNTLIGVGDKEYTLISKKAADGSAVYKSEDGAYIKAQDIYTAENGTTKYYKKEDGTFALLGGDGSTVDGVDSSKLTKSTTYYNATEKITWKSADKDGEGKEISYEVQSRSATVDGQEKTQYFIQDKEGKEYVSDSLTGTFKASDDTTISVSDVTYDYVSAADATPASVDKAADLYKAFQDKVQGAYATANEGKTEEEAKAEAESILSKFAADLATVNTFEKQAAEETDAEQAAPNSKTALMGEIKDAYAIGGKAAVATKNADQITRLTTLTSTQKAAETAMKENEAVASLEGLAGDEKANALKDMVNTAMTGATVLTNTSYKSTAVKVDGTDAKIKLNGVEYTGASNNITVNGMTVNAMSVTGDGDDKAITINTKVDNQGVYDKIKDFLSEFNALINELNKEYNAEYVKPTEYEPLTDDEKEEMSDKEIEKWEEKIQGSLLRHDSTLNGLMNAMTAPMFESIKIGDKNYSLASFGIQTLGFLNAAKNEQYAFHIDGDADDDATSGRDDKLMAMINEDPEAVSEFFMELSKKLYSSLDSRMKSSSLNSANSVYADKQMKTQISSYEKLIKEWATKLTEKEDYYYKKFSKMESSLSSINSTQSSLSSYFQ